MRSPLDSNGRRARSQYGNLLQDRTTPQPQKKSGWLATLGRVLRDQAALIAALLALAGVLITQVVTTNNTQEGLKAQQDQEEQRAVAAEWQTYLDDMGKMILDERNPLPKAKPDSAVASLARAKTLTMLNALDARSDAQRKGLLLQFLYESNLISVHKGVHKGDVVRLIDANLRKADLSDAKLSDANLEGTNLEGANLEGADLEDANLQIAHLEDAHLTGANLEEGHLTGADLRGADLTGADLTNAHLTRTKVTNEELESQAKSLKGAIMPDGTRHD